MNEPDIISTLVQEIVSQSSRLGLTWSLRPAAVIDITSNPITLIQLDGDDQIVTALNIAGQISLTTRVMCLIVPPSGIYIIGRTLGIPAEVSVTAGAGMVDIAGTFNVVNTDGNINISAHSVDLNPAIVAGIAASMKKYVNSAIGDGSNSTIDVTHGISGGVSVIYGPALMDNSTKQIVIPDYVLLSSSVIRLIFGSVPSLNQYTLSFGY